MAQKIKRSRKSRIAFEAKAKRKQDLRLILDSFMIAMTTAPSFDLRRTQPGLYDRRRSSAGSKEACEE
jgi:hypothetical protein